MRSLATFLILCFLLSACNRIDTLNEKPITIEADFMQYACGDWNDDMKITKVLDTTYSFLLQKDIDPLFIEGEEEIREWLFENKTEDYMMKYRLIGYISKSATSGCDNLALKFWITKIEKLNSEPFKMN